MSDNGIRTAVREWCEELARTRAASKAKYGPIASWDTSEITGMYGLFEGRAGFNEDISRWDVSNVRSMNFTFAGATSFNSDISCWQVGAVATMFFMFDGATSFTHQLDGAWSDNTVAIKDRMFRNSPGSIARRAKSANGSIGDADGVGNFR